MSSSFGSMLAGAVMAAGLSILASSANATVIVPGTADIWAWNGGALPYDAKGGSTVADILPVLAVADLDGIGAITFTVSGETANCPGCFTVNGAGAPISHTNGAANYLPDLTAPLDSLVGAWINPSDPSVNTPFEIGAGGTFIVPAGATELYLGSMDAHEWNNNLGQFAVELALHPVPEPLSLSLFGAGLLGAMRLRRRLIPLR